MVKINTLQLLSAAQDASKGTQRPEKKGDKVIITSANCFRLDIKKNQVVITGSCPDLSMKANVDDVEADEEFAVITSAEILLKMLPRVASEYLELKRVYNENNELTSLQIKGGEFDTKTAVIPLEQWVELPIVENGNQYQLSAELLNDAVSGCFHAVGAPTMENAIAESCDVIFGNNKIKISCTDTKRIAIRDYLGGDVANSPVLIRGNILRDVANSMKGNVTVTVSDTKVTFVSEGVTATVTLTAGAFYAIERMIPSESPITTTVNRLGLIEELDTAYLISDKVLLKISGTIMEISGIREDGSASFRTVVPVETTHDFEIAVNPKFLADALKSVSDEYVTLGFITNQWPMIIQGEEYTEVILPLKM